MINGFEVPWALLFDDFFDLFLYSINDLFGFDLLFENRVGPIDAGGIGGVVKSKLWSIAQEFCDANCVLRSNQKGALAGWAFVRNDLDMSAGNRCFNARLELLERVHGKFYSVRVTAGGCHTSGLLGGSKACSPNLGIGNSLGAFASRCRGR